VFVPNLANQQITGLIHALCLYFQQIRVFPQLLGINEINAMLVQICVAFGFVKFKHIHEYKLFLFYSPDKRVLQNLDQPLSFGFQIGRHPIGDPADSGVFHQLAGTEGFPGAIKFQSLHHHIHADATPELKTVRQGFRRVVYVYEDSIHVHPVNARTESPPGESTPGHRWLTQYRQASIPIHHQVHLVGNLCSYVVPGQRFAQAKLAAVLSEQALELCPGRLGGAGIRQTVTTY